MGAQENAGLPQAPEDDRRQAQNLSENAREMKRVRKARFLRNLLHQHARLLQTLGGVANFQAEEILVRRLGIIAAE